MPRRAPALECSAEDRARLTVIATSRTEEVRAVERARIILARLDGGELQQVARDLGASVPTVTKWCKRFSLLGLRGLMDDPRSGKPATYDAAFRDRVLALLDQPPLPGAPLWDGPGLAEKLGCSVDAVWGVLRRERMYLQRLRSWSVSTDEEFAPKAADVVGLYLNPPLNVVLLSMDEKPMIQTVRPPSGYVETDSSAIVRALKSAHRRHGALDLSAALRAGTGRVRTKITENKKRADFYSFLDDVIADHPPDAEIHAILDNYPTHKNDDWLVKYEGRVQFHLTPASATWLSQIGIVFSLLQRKPTQGAGFKAKDRLRDAIEGFIHKRNECAKPFRWRKREVKGSQFRNPFVDLSG
jgi:transposase